MPWPAPGTVRIKFDPVLAMVASALFNDTSLNLNAPRSSDAASTQEALRRGWLTADRGTSKYDLKGDDWRGVSVEGAKAVAQAILSATKILKPEG